MGETLEECRQMLQDDLREMIIAYRQQNKEIPIGRALLGGTLLRRGLIPFDNCSNNVDTDLSVRFFGHEQVRAYNAHQVLLIVLSVIRFKSSCSNNVGTDLS